MLKVIMDIDIIIMGTFTLLGCLELAGLDWLEELLVKPGNELHAASNQSSQRLQSSRTHWLVLPFTIIVSIVISLLCTFDEPHNSSSRLADYKPATSGVGGVRTNRAHLLILLSSSLLHPLYSLQGEGLEFAVCSTLWIYFTKYILI